jgi:hypothetical protein
MTSGNARTRTAPIVGIMSQYAALLLCDKLEYDLPPMPPIVVLSHLDEDI